LRASGPHTREELTNVVFDVEADCVLVHVRGQLNDDYVPIDPHRHGRR
jgi:hypothetical protein